MTYSSVVIQENAHRQVIYPGRDAQGNLVVADASEVEGLPVTPDRTNAQTDYSLRVPASSSSDEPSWVAGGGGGVSISQGTWSPRLGYIANNAFTTWTSPIAYEQQEGSWTRIGNMVFVTFAVALSSITLPDSHTQLYVSGPPLTIATSRRVTITAENVRVYSTSDTVGHFGIIASTSTGIALSIMEVARVSNRLSGVDVGSDVLRNDTGIFGSFSYVTNAS